MDAELPPRLTDWTIFGVVALSVLTGLVSLVSGRLGDWWVFWLHGMGGLVLVALLFWKFRRVYRRVTAATWTRETVISVALATVAVGALGTGIAWASGANLDLALWNLMNLHVLLGLLVVPLVGWHLRHRFRPPAPEDFEGRRTALSYLALAGFGVGAWSLQRGANRLLDLSGADHRFTGSRERGSFAGNAYPVTSWMADDPHPVDPGEWSLTVVGAVEEPVAVGYDALAEFDDRAVATLDCTSGWYSEGEWAGIRVGRLLDRAEAHERARWVSFRSVTGYRWSLPVGEAREALLATRIDGEELSHGHGFPARLVAPGRRGFQWVKWVETVEVRTDPDPGQLGAIFLSWTE